MKKLILTLLIVSQHALALDFHIKPYLQRIDTDEMMIKWEGAFSDSEVRWGLTPDALLNKSKANVQASIMDAERGENKLFQVSLSGLTPNTTYYYQVASGKDHSEVLKFTTADGKEETFAFLAMSDAQMGDVVTTKNIRESVMKHAFHEYQDAEKFPLRFFLFAGDLVQKGREYPRWKKEFFDPIAPVLSQIPVYPSLGNHEENSQHYFEYFDLPMNGTPGFEEHWYYYDYNNIRFIALDTNKQYRTDAQLQWLEETLKDAETTPGIDFVIAQFHHPHKSELWLPGETEFSGKIEKLLINFTKKTEIPSIYFCGHTHAYSRGHSLETNHTMLVIGSIGGGLDMWGEYPQADYVEYTKSLDQFGWMMAQVTTGEKAQILLKRFSFGNEAKPQDEGIVDTFVLKRNNLRPEAPVYAAKDIQDDTISLELLPLVDRDNDSHMTTHVQISSDNEVKDFYFQSENWYGGIDLNAGLDLTKLQIANPFGPKKVAVRVRYRDSALGWSDWSY